MTDGLPDTFALRSGAPRTLEGVLAELRRVALHALDAGEPLAAARIAAMADQIEAEAWPTNPPRPDYRRPR